MGLLDAVNNAIAQRAGQAAVVPAPVGTGAPGYPASAGAHLGTPAPNGGYPVQSAPGGFDPSFAFGQAPPQAPPQPAPAPQAAPFQGPPGHPPFGTPTHDPNYVHDGQGNYQFRPAQAAPAAPPMPTTFPSHVNPPEAAQQAPAPAPTGAPAPAEVPTATKGKRGRPPKATPAEVPQTQGTIVRDTTPAPADFAAPTVELTLRYGGLTISCAAPADLQDTLTAYVIKQVQGS